MTRPKLVSVTIHGNQQRLLPEAAAERLVHAYGADAYEQEITAARSAFFATWLEVDRLLLDYTDIIAAQDQAKRLVGEGRMPFEELVEIVKEFGDDDARAIIGRAHRPDWWGEVSSDAGDDRCPGCGSPNICEQTREDQSPWGCLDCGEERIERPANRANGDIGRVSV